MDEFVKNNELLMRMVKLVLPTAESDPLHGVSSAIYRLVRNVLRKNIMRVQAIALLNSYEKLSDSALEIVRNTIEDTISINYILSDKDPENLALKFFEYRYIQAKQDLDYYSKIPDYLGGDLGRKREGIIKDYKRVINEYPEFLDDQGCPRHTWASDGIDKMAEILRKRKVYTRANIHNMMRAYQLGSWKVHFNPDDLLNFHDQTVWDRASKKALDISIKGTAASFMSLVVRYFDTVNHYDKTVDGTKIVGQLYDIVAAIHGEKQLV